MTSRSEAALALAAEGHPVLPLHTPDELGRCSCGRGGRCDSPGKHPRGVYGLRSTTTHPEAIEFLWHGQPSANIGMRCDGLLVFDLDYGGARSLAELESELGELPETRGQSSGRGEHRFYSLPAGVRLGNSTAPLGRPKGLDLRAGDRGYVVAAPSRHASGRRDRWHDPEAPFAPLPKAWLQRLLRPPRRPATLPLPSRDSTRYGLVALGLELEKLLRAQEGERNERLNRSVFRLAQLVAGGELAGHDLEAAALDSALVAGLPAGEARKTIASAIEAGLRFPRRRR